jgi:hypothetical protein
MASTPAERPVDIMADLRERMVRIETLLLVRVERDLETTTAIASNSLAITALQTESAVLKAQIKTLRWIGAVALAVATFLGDNVTRLFQ